MDPPVYGDVYSLRRETLIAHARDASRYATVATYLMLRFRAVHTVLCTRLYGHGDQSGARAMVLSKP